MAQAHSSGLSIIFNVDIHRCIPESRHILVSSSVLFARDLTQTVNLKPSSLLFLTSFSYVHTIE